MRRALAVAVALAGLAAAPTTAAPFGYLHAPTDQVAVPGAASGTEITPAGGLYTGWAEVDWAFGPTLRTWEVPTRTLADGRYPVLGSHRATGGVDYRLRVWASRVAGVPVTWAEVTLSNRRRTSAVARWAARVRWSGGRRRASGQYAFRFIRPATPAAAGAYAQPGAPFAPGARYAWAGRTLVRDGAALLVASPRTVSGAISHVARVGGLEPGTEGGRVRYRVELAPGATRHLVFRVPTPPPTAGSAGLAAIAAAAPDAARRSALRSWRRTLARGASIEVPEGKVEHAWYASLVHILEARVHTSEGVVQAVNRLNYHAFWLRDGAMLAAALDVAGLHREAEGDLGFFARFQRPDGLFISRPEQFDGFGQALWAYGEHVRLGGGAAYARRVLPAVSRAMAWLRAQRARDPTGLMPSSRTYDNEQVGGRLAGDDFWAVAGARSAVDIAREAGEPRLAAAWRREAAALRASVRAAARAAARRHGGAIPPSLDTPGGHDWGNAWAAWPGDTFAPGDPIVTATLRHFRRHFREGIATYGRALHGYLGFRVLETELERGESGRVVDGLYAALAHTTATHGGFEIGPERYGAGEVGNNLTPHGWWAAEYVMLVRNMLVREEGGRSLVLLSAVPGGWLAPGRRVAISRAPTRLGRVSFELRSRTGGATLRWRAAVPPGTRLVWPVPGAVHGVRAPGLDRRRRLIVLPGRRGRLSVDWRGGRPGPSYSQTVRRLVTARR